VIIRILGEGQFDVPDSALDELNRHDGAVVTAVEAGDEQAFAGTLGDLLRAVKAAGTPTPEDYLGPSDFVLPGADSTLAEVREILGEEGLLPG
jgi:hypothetical protein